MLAKITRWFWMWLCRFAYRQWRKHEPMRRMPVGVPLHRDPHSECAMYEPGKPGTASFYRDCMSDGHYLCRECTHLSNESPHSPNYVQEVVDVRR